MSDDLEALREELDAALEEAAEVFEGDPDDDESQPDCILAMPRFAESEQLKGQVLEFLHEKINEPGENFIALAAAAVALARIGDKSSAGPLLSLFNYLRSDDVGHEENQSSGQAALALAAVDHRDALPDLEEWLTDNRWSDSVFHAMTRYAVWMLKPDAQGALEFVRDGSNKSGLGYAAAALADLNSPDASDELKSQAAALERDATRLAFEEAVARLAKQGQAPGPGDWMVWMHGVVHPYEVALGSKTDNQFALRAHESPPPEADEDPPDDR